MRHEKLGWIVGTVYFFACIAASADEKNAGLIDVDVAQATHGDAQKTSDRYIDGLKLYRQGRFIAASRAFRDAYHVSSDWKILYHMGKCEIALKRYGVAAELFEAYWENGGYHLSKARETEVLHILDTLQKKIGRIDVAGKTGARVYVDGMERGMLPLTKKIAISSGVRHRLLIRRGDTVLLDRFIQIAGNEELEITVPPEAPAISMVQKVNKPGNEIDFNAIRATKRSRRKLQTAALSAMGVGALGLTGSLMAVAYAKNKRDELIDICDNQTPCVATPARIRKYNDAESAANAATVLFATGVTLAVVGTALLVAMKRQSKKKPLGKSFEKSFNESIRVQVHPSLGAAVVISRDF